MSFPKPHRLALAAASIAAALAAVSVVPAGAQEPDPLDPAVDVAIELFRTRTRLDEVTQRVADAELRLTAAQAALAEAERQIAETTAKIDDLLAELQGRAAIAYTSQGQSLDALLAIDQIQDIAVGERYTDAAAGDGNTKLDQLEAIRAQLEEERARRDAARQAIADEKAQLDTLRADLEAVRARDQQMLDRMGGVPVMGDSRLTPEQIVAWYRSTGQAPRLAPGTTIDDLARIYVEEGAAEHIRGDIAFAQSIIETGSFGEAPDNNFAGVGTCDSCPFGYSFPTPRDGVRGQIQLLRSYADPDSRASNLANPPVAGVFGNDPATAAYRYNTFGLKGVAPVWNVMGDGNWATDPFYAHKVLEVYARMLGFNALR
jgi:flagellum-specific peptidoglycan hydrolase FlgJ